MEIITELEKGEKELDLMIPEDLEATKEIDIDKINEELEKTQIIELGEDNG